MIISSLVLFACSVSATVIPRASNPIVSLDYGTFQGGTNGTVDYFLGVPYAQPPVGNLRFRKPLAPLALEGTQDVTKFGHACMQQAYTLPYIPDLNYTALQGFVGVSTPSEDCLNLNVFRPTGTSNTAKLPVVVYFYGGGFETGDASSYNATNFVVRSQTLKTPVIFVAVNHRVNAFGFLAGKQVLDAGLSNIGIHDQILALSWVQSKIASFGGDPRKVTLWGESSGGASIITQMVLNANNPNPPFRAAIVHSTFTPPQEHVTDAKFQYYYDNLVESTNCSTAADPLDCLRTVPAQAIVDFVNTTPPQFNLYGINFTWTLTVDGLLLNKTLKHYIRDSQYKKVPLIGGQVDDEGTLFTIYSQNVSEAQFDPYISTEFLPLATPDEVSALAAHYPSDPAAGSPFNTGNKSALTLQFKRIAAIQGDYYFQAGRREAFSHFRRSMPVWSFLWKRRKDLLYIGSVHGGELPEFYSKYTSDFVGTDAYINFINNLNPNIGAKIVNWPAYNAGQQMLVFSDNATEAYMTIADNYRADGIGAAIALQKQYAQ